MTCYRAIFDLGTTLHYSEIVFMIQKMFFFKNKFIKAVFIWLEIQ